MTQYNKVDEDLWWEVAKQCNYATFFHTPLWHRLATETYPSFRDATVGIKSSDGVKAVLPLLEIPSRTQLFAVRQSTFAGCYGGPIADGAIDESIVRNLCHLAISRRTKQLKLLSNPFAPMSDFRGELVCEGHDSTDCLSLEQGYEAVAAQFSSSHRRNIRKGQRMGAEVREAKALDEYQIYYRVYQDSLRRWGDTTSSSYPWRLFENGWQLAQRYPDCLKLWIAEVDERIVAGAWVFYWNRHAVYWHGAALEEFFSHKPANVLHDAIIKDACDRSFCIYDFNPSGGHEGVAQFKRKHGTEQRTVTLWEYRSSLFSFGQSLKSLFRSNARK